jgi:hypothetical protein
MPIPNFSGPPEIPTGYELSPVKSYWSLLIPEATTNMFPNGSFERVNTGPDGAALTNITTNCSMTLNDTTQAARGLYSMKINPVSMPSTGGYYVANTNFNNGAKLTPNVPYTFSCDVYSVSGGAFAIYLEMPGMVAPPFAGGIAIYNFTHPGGWYRPSATFTLTSDIGAVNCGFAVRKLSGTNDSYWLDGYQLEQNSHATFYCDGDQPGCVWIGTAYNVLTTSQRLAYNPDGTVAPGNLINFKDLGLDVFAQTNTGLPDPQNLTVARGLLGGARYQRTTSKSHILVLQCLLDAAGGVGAPMTQLEKQRELLTTYFAPDALSQNAAPVGLRYQLMDNCGKTIGKALDMPCYYLSGLAGNTDNLFAEKISLSFIRYTSPALNETLETAKKMTLNSTFTSGGTAPIVLQRNAGAAFAGLAAPFGNTSVNKIITAPGLLKSPFYLAGNSHLTEGIQQFYVGIGSVLDASLINTESPYIGGAWVGPPDNFALVTALSAAGSGVTTVGSAAPNGTVRAVLNDTQGNVYIAGDFTTVGGISANRIAKYNIAGNSWTALGSGLNATGRALAIDQQGNIYIGGDFTTVNGVASQSFAKYNPATGAFTVLSAATTGSVYTIVVGTDNTVYLGGTITLIGGVTVANVAAYNGFNFRALGNGLNGQVNQLALDNFNVLFAAGAFTSTGTVTLGGKGTAKYIGGLWISVPLNISTAPTVASIAVLPSATRDTSLAVGLAAAGITTFTYEGITTFTYVGSAGVRPKIIIRGPGALYQISNLTTGKNLYFNYTLIAGEVATLDLTPDNINFTSNYQGNVIGKMLSNSDIVDFGLNPGSNTISCFMTGTSGTSSIEFYWKNAHWSFDASAY